MNHNEDENRVNAAKLDLALIDMKRKIYDTRKVDDDLIQEQLHFIIDTLSDIDRYVRICNRLEVDLRNNGHLEILHNILEKISILRAFIISIGENKFFLSYLLVHVIPSLKDLEKQVEECNELNKDKNNKLVCLSLMSEFHFFIPG